MGEAIPSTQFTSGIRTQWDAHNPIRDPPPPPPPQQQANQQQQQQQPKTAEDAKVEETLSKLPPEAQVMFKNINKDTFSQAVDYLRNIIDEVWRGAQAPTQAPVAAPVQVAPAPAPAPVPPPSTPVAPSNAFNFDFSGIM